MTSERATAGNLWQASSVEHIDAPPLGQDCHTDLVVVGGGFTGCSAALTAAEAGASVVLLEAEVIGHGGSGRNVGLVNAGLWLPPDALIAAMGTDAANRLITILAGAPQAVFDRIQTHDISCEATRRGTLHCAHSRAGLQELRRRFLQGNRHGAPLQLIDGGQTASRTGTSAFFGSLLDPRAGTVQPRAYCQGLARSAASAGAALHDHSPATHIARDGDEWIITANGHNVRARCLLMATNAYHLGLSGPYSPKFVPVCYSQFATIPMPAPARDRILAGGEGCWDTALIMSSFRTDQAGRMIVGGIGNLEGPGSAIHGDWARRKLRQLFPEIGDLPFEYAWHGRIAMTCDHIPKILNFGPNALAPFGYSGRGIGPGTVFGAATASALLSGDLSGLPVTPVRHYAPRFCTPRAAYYEAGATITHATTPRPFR